MGGALRLREPGLPSRAHWDRTHHWSRERYPDHGSGTLAIEICCYSGRDGRPYRWSDRRSWRLEDKLPDVLREVEIRAAEDEHRRRQAEREKAERQRRWEAAVRQAEARLIESARGERLLQQVDRWRQAQHMHEYLAAMRATIDAMADPEAARAAEEWFAWARTYAEQLNPLTQRLAMPPPPKATPDALKPFLDGRSPYGPTW